MRARAIDTERRMQHVHDARVGGLQIGEAEPRVGQRAGHAGIEYEVCSCNKLQERRAIRSQLQIQHDRALAAVVGNELQAALGFRRVGQPGMTGAPRASTRGLDLDHIGAQIAKDHAGHLAAVVGQV